MRTIFSRLSTALLLVLLNVGVVATVSAQRTYRETDTSMRNLIRRIETRSDTFSRVLENALDRSHLNGTAREDEVNRLVTEFEADTDQLRERFENRQSTAADARMVLTRGARIDTFLINNRLGASVDSQWRLLRNDLDQLARAYYINDWYWGGGTVGGAPVYNDAQLRQLVRQLELRTNQFSRNVRRDLNRGVGDSWQREEARRHLSEFETSLNRLRNRVNSRQSSTSDVQLVLNHAAYLNSFVAGHSLNVRAERDWDLIRSDLNQLANTYNIAWNWDATPGGPVDTYARLTGTYRLTSQSTDARASADAATRHLPPGQRQRVYESLLRRLDPPDVLAIDQRGTNVTIASSRAPQINFVADGREHVETNEIGRTIRVRAHMRGDQLTVERTGDRAEDFTVTFDPTDNGRRLVVTRRLYSDRLNQPVTVQSFYDKTSEVAQLDIYRGDDYPNPDTVSGDFVVPNGTQLVATLNSDLSTERVREGDRFTMTVRSPNQFSGATIEGRVLSVDRGGRLTGRSQLTLDFDTIRMNNGSTYRFAGILETVRTPDNEVVRVDNEGAVREDSQTNRTITRTAIGTAVGAIIGAIAGGGKGAAIGAVIGAGTGAGSVYIQGRDDLELPPGTEVTLRATGPR